MSIVTYNGVTLPYPWHSQFSQQAVMDESGTDWMYIKFDIALQCVVSSDYIRLLLPDLEGAGNPDSPAAVMKVVRTRLLEPRRQLSVIVNGVELIPAATARNQGLDAKNGPQPQMCDITALNSESFIVSYRIIAHYWENTNQSAVNDDLIPTPNQGGPVLNNRWTETVTIDKFMASTRTRSGTFIIRSDNLDNVIADQLRSQMAILGVPDGFMRESASYTQSPDGLSIKYDIVDKEYYKAPPKLAYEAHGHIALNTARNGAYTTGEVRLQLKGTMSDTFTPQSRLIQAAMAIAAQKLYLAGAIPFSDFVTRPKNARGFAMLERASVVVDMYENVVTVVLAARLMRGKKRISGVSFGAGAFAEEAYLTQTPGSPIGAPRPVVLDRGTAGILLQAAAYYDPSLAGNRLQGGEAFVNNALTLVTGKTDTQMIFGAEIGREGAEDA